MKKSFTRMIFIIILCSVILWIPQKVNAIDKYKVLFISAYNTSFISFSDQIEGIKVGFDGNAEVQIEYLDFERMLSKTGEESFYNLLKYKISSYNDFDAIILADDEALEFGLKYRENLFGNIPVVFMGVSNEENIQEALKLKLVSGVKEVNAFDDNVALITKLHKNVKNITFINNKMDKGIADACKSLADKYPKINFRTLLSEEMYYDDFKEELTKFDSDDAIVMLYPHSFKDGKELNTMEAIAMTSNLIKAPIYSVVNYGVGDGFLGGNVVSHLEQGKKAAEIAKEMMLGRDGKELYVGDNSTNVNIFDYNKLEEYKASDKQLPEDSVVLNKPKTFLEENEDIIVPATMVLLSLITIIVVLAIYSIKVTKNEKELVKAKREAEEANKSKGNFISNINHELRTPVTVIMAANKLLKLKLDSYGKEELTGNLDVINQNCYRLLRLINNIIDVAKVDSGFNELKLKNMNVVELFEMIVLSVVPYAKEKNIEIVFDTTDEELIMAVDPNKIERIVLNLLSNAIKFSKDNGLIVAEVIIETEKVIFNVTDNGIGIDSEYLEKIFNKFTQVDNTFTRENEGSGIGLSLVKSFVEMHSGRVRVQSVLGNGTRFSIELPITVIEEEEIQDLEIVDEEATIIRTRVEFSDIYF